MEIVRQLDKQRWRDFVDKHPQGNIFHTPEMFQVFARAKSHKPELWAAIDNDDQVLALLLPVRISLTNGALRYFTTRSVAYGSVLCTSDSAGLRAVKQLLRTYVRDTGKTTLFTELRNLSDLHAVQPAFNAAGFVFEDHLNYLIDLERPVKEIWRSVKSDVRTNVRKARKMGVIIEEATSIDELRAGYAVLEDVYRRIRVPLVPFSLFEVAFERLYSQKMLRCFLARLEDTCIGVAIRLLYKGTIYAWYAGVRREHAAYKAHDFLNWYVLEWGAKNGYQLFDFGGAGKPDEDYGPRRFKAKFRGRLVSYGRNIYVHTPTVLRLSELGYQISRRFVMSRLKSG